jgi:UDP-glucose-4-epimerase GalE
VTAILVTGGAGYVGSHACKALVRAGFTPVAYDNLSRGQRRFARFGPLEVGDIRDRERLDAAMRRHAVQAVMHFAAYAYVGESVREPALYYQNNLAGTLDLLDVMRARGVGLLVFSSTCSTYGVPERMPISEDTEQRPINPYGMSKLAVERALSDYRAAYGLRAVALRYFNAAGADADGEIGEDHEPEPHLVPRVLMAAAGALPRVDIYGTDYPTPDGTCVRDYVHVADLGDGHVQALEYLRGGGDSAALNLGTGRGYSVREVIAAAERVTGRAIPVNHAPRRAGDPPVLVADASRARAVLGFAPRHAEIEDIVATAWRWHREQNV